MDEVVVWYGVLVASLMLGVPFCKQRRKGSSKIWKWWLFCGLMVFVSIFSSLTFGIFGFVLSHVPFRNTFHISTECKILSKGVDLRSGKTCEFGKLSQTSLAILGISGFSKLGCSLDYYWASVFKVEFQPENSLLPIQTFAEVPQVALPSHCRPDFSDALSITESFQVNESYKCMYSPGARRPIEILTNSGGNCTLPKTSSLKVFRDLVVMVLNSDKFLSSSGNAANILQQSIFSVLTGFLSSTSLLLIAKITGSLNSRLLKQSRTSSKDAKYFRARFQVAGLVLMLIPALGWIWGEYLSLNSLKVLTSGLQHE